MYIQKQEFQEAIDANIVVVVFVARLSDVVADAERIFADLSAEYDDRLDVYLMDVDEYPEVADDYGIVMIPTVGIFVDKKPKLKIEGVRDLDFYKQHIKNLAL